MHRYRVTLKGSDLHWYEHGIGPTEAAAKVCAVLNNLHTDISGRLSTNDFWIQEVEEVTGE